jgi:hypothetical protein
VSEAMNLFTYDEYNRYRPSLALCNRLALAVGANVKDLRGGEAGELEEAS